MIERKQGSRTSRRTVSALRAGLLPLALWASILAAQEPARETLEVGVVGQTTGDLYTPPCTVVSVVSGDTLNCTQHEQAFGGPELGYRYALTPNFALEGRVGYLFGHQPTVNLSGGNELLGHFGVRASLPLRGRLALFARVAPGFSSFRQANRFIQPPSTVYQLGRITHFSLEKAVGLNYRLSNRTALSFAVSEMSLIEGDEYQGFVPAVPCVPPYNSVCLPNGSPIVSQGGVEEHLLAHVGLERSFGDAFSTEEDRRQDSADRRPRSEVLFLWANQPQTYLSTGYLAASNGFGLEASHWLLRWLDLDAAALTLPGGDAANYQDGGSKTELFVGLRAGLRRRYYGIFAKFRPGLVTSPDTRNTSLTPSDPYVRNFNVAADAGAVIEVYPTGQHFVMRLDFGEVGTRYGAVNVTTSSGVVTQPVRYNDAGLFAFGVGWRF